jgi:hypothetical protein
MPATPRWVLAPMGPVAAFFDHGVEQRTDQGGLVSIVAWIVMALGVLGSIELVARAATTGRSTVEVRDRSIHHRPNR